MTQEERNALLKEFLQSAELETMIFLEEDQAWQRASFEQFETFNIIPVRVAVIPMI